MVLSVTAKNVLRYCFQNSDANSCKVLLQVRDTDAYEDIVDQQTVPCRSQKFHFQSVSLLRQKFYEVCAKLTSETDTAAEPGSQNFQCVNVESETKNLSTSNVLASASKTSTSATLAKEPILPLVLTLIFLSFGIAVLVILYLVVKGYLNDRHRAGFLPEPALTQSRRVFKIINSLFSSHCMTCSVFSLKHRRRRQRRDHLPVDQVDEFSMQVDEFSLQDNLTVTSFMSD